MCNELHDFAAEALALYEQQKERLLQQALTPEEYESRIKAIADILGV